LSLALVLLNCETDGSFFFHLWHSAKLRICADGGANKLYQRLAPQVRPLYIPYAICGDFDSVLPEVASYYQSQGTHLVKVVDDNNTDLDKCLQYLIQLDKEASIRNVVLYGAFGGRFDQTMAALHSIYKFDNRFDRLILLSEGNLAELLSAGNHFILCNPKVQGVGSICGIFPLSSICRSIKTEGLQWNLHGETMQFGNLISTSNIIKSDTVSVHTSDPVIWTTSWQRVGVSICSK